LKTINANGSPEETWNEVGRLVDEVNTKKIKEMDESSGDSTKLFPGDKDRSFDEKKVTLASANSKSRVQSASKVRAASGRDRKSVVELVKPGTRKLIRILFLLYHGF
jgi:hypothetical protein